MNKDFSTLSLHDLYDKLSELTTMYSKSLLNGFSELEFSVLRSQIEDIQKEIAHRKTPSSKSNDACGKFSSGVKGC
jgi:hypothetical protein